MYSKEDITKSQNKLKSAMLLFICIALILLALIVTSFVYRLQWASILATCILGFFAIFYISMLLIPQWRYIQNLALFIDGRKRTLQGEVLCIGTEVLQRDGMDCFEIIVKTGEDIHGNNTVLCYMDIHKTFDFTQGDTVDFELFDRFVCKYSIGDVSKRL